MSKALRIIKDAVGEVLAGAGFSAMDGHVDEVIFAREDAGYVISFNKDKKCLSLNECSITENGNVEPGRGLAVWLFDPDSCDAEKQIKGIAADFASTVAKVCTGAKSGVVADAGGKKRKKTSDENNVDPLFLMNRIINIFPELKNDMQQEKENYGQVRWVTFARQKALPHVAQVLNSGVPRDKFKKLCSVFSHLYASGDLSVRGMITMVFFNAVDDETARCKIKSQLSDDLVAAMDEAYKLRDRKIRPEKVKKSYIKR